MEFEWCEDKRVRTLADRGLDFRDAHHLFDGRSLYTVPSPREGEARFVSIGVLGRQVVAMVWMERDGARRIISMRRARNGEEREYRALLG